MTILCSVISDYLRTGALSFFGAMLADPRARVTTTSVFQFDIQRLASSLYSALCGRLCSACYDYNFDSSIARTRGVYNQPWCHHAAKLPRLIMRKGLSTSSMLERRDVTSQANCSSGFDWMNNSLNPRQSPCFVAAYLRSPCSRDGSANVGPLPEPGSYQAPAANKCLCSWADLSMCCLPKCSTRYNRRQSEPSVRRYKPFKTKTIVGAVVGGVAFCLIVAGLSIGTKKSNYSGQIYSWSQGYKKLSSKKELVPIIR
ncbi:uncharacterized protein FOMMEDRAFT_29669 [Fomitiporia mediterranea MF3/22]|uniref:uncharacterized protein n=1 Tax=Fomitiporia mediterranea (strain MF3/22) TaxID=694068 RepID=UPI0004409AD6|nr:uncharacterized protein FOMMEDRAFT_29669 [Fomitiporia mediterranea MF3/22]EJD00863.1 hypothetical protein FOMMEDRAFT_29669 [Fomitiporia mediterranea MF3/22]